MRKAIILQLRMECINVRSFSLRCLLFNLPSIRALQEAKLVQKHDRLCDLAALDAIPTEVLKLLKLDIQIAIARQSVTAERILVALAGQC